MRVEEDVPVKGFVGVGGGGEDLYPVCDGRLWGDCGGESGFVWTVGTHVGLIAVERGDGELERRHTTGVEEINSADESGTTTRGGSGAFDPHKWKDLYMMS